MLLALALGGFGLVGAGDTSLAGANPSGALGVDATFLSGLDHPWDLAFLPDGTMFVTERPGRLDVRLPDGRFRTLAIPTDVVLGSEGGLLGVAVDPAFETNRFLYTCMSSRLGAGGPDNRVSRYTVAPALDSVTARTDIVTGLPWSTGRHSGCRVRFGPDGALWVGTGDAATGTVPQDLHSLGGKVLRVDRDGNPAAGNPNLGAGADPRIYDYGHRNVQGLAFDPTSGAAYDVEHGTSCDDEVNRLVAGGNGGWDPVPGYDESRPMTDTVKFPNARRAAWSSGCPTIAPSGATFVTGPQWRGWNGALAVAVLKDTELRIMFLDDAGENVTHTVTPPELDVGVRLRSVVQGPDGNLYVATDSAPGFVWKVTPPSTIHRVRRVR